MNTQRISLTTLGVRNISAAVAFYRKLGWEPFHHEQDVAFYRMNGAVFGFFTLDGLARESNCAPEDMGTGAMTLAQNFPTEAEVDAAYNTAIEAGAKALKPPTKADWGGYFCSWADPDGHVWQYAMNPFWPLDDDGNVSLPE